MNQPDNLKSYIAFSMSKHPYSATEIYIINHEGTGLKKLTETPAGREIKDNRPLCWTPDGNIAFLAQDDKNQFISIIDTDGNHISDLTLHALSGIESIAWAWDNSSILVVSRDDAGKKQIFKVNPDSAEIKQLTFEGNNTEPSFSPDGEKIAFISDRCAKPSRASGGGKAHIYMMESDGSDQKLAIDDAVLFEHSLASPAWSPNGKYIAFKCQASGIWVMDSDGTNARRLTVMTGDTSPVWAPDGSKLAFIHGVMAGDVGIFLITADGKGIRKYLYDCQTEDQNTADRVLNLAWSHFLELDAESRGEKADFEIPKELTPHAEIGVAYDRHGQYEEALQEFEAAYELNPEDADMLAQLANAYLMMYQHQKAVDTSERALNLFPTPYRKRMARMVKAMGCDQLQQTDQAIEEWEIFLSLATRRQDKVIGHKGLVSVYGQRGSLLLGMKQLQKAYELNPNDDEIRQNLAMVQGAIQQNADMINQKQEEENALKLQFLEVIASTMIAAGNIGSGEAQAYEILRHADEVYANAAVAKNDLTDIPIVPSQKHQPIEILEKEEFIVKTGADEYSITNKGIYSFYFALGNLHYHNQNYQKAADCYAQAYIMDRTEHSLFQHQARCHLELKEWEKAINKLELLLFEEPDDLNAYPLLTQAYAQAHEATQNEKYRIKARESFYRLRAACQRVLSEEPDNEMAASILEKLSELKDEAETAPPTTSTTPTENNTIDEKSPTEREEQRLRSEQLEAERKEREQRQREQQRREQERQEIEQSRLREVRRSQGLCVECGAKLSLFDKMRGKTRCKQHR